MFSKPVYIFGSFVRGDNNLHSDIDILIISNSKEDEIEENIKNLFFKNNKEKLSFSYYSLETLKKYFDTGDLFSWHLSSESKLLGGEDVIRKFGQPSNYKFFKRDIIPLIKLFRTINSSLLDKDSSLCYEAGLIYLCIRNIGHSLSWFNSSGPDFRKNSSLNLMNKIFFLPIAEADLSYLMNARVASTRANVEFCPDKCRLLLIFQSLSSWIDVVEDFILKGGYE